MRARALSRAAPVGLALALGLLGPGCFSIRFRNSKAAPEAGEPREKWHHGVLNGLIEASGPVKVDEICAHGMAEVSNQVTVPNGLVQAASGFAASYVGAELFGNRFTAAQNQAQAALERQLTVGQKTAQSLVGYWAVSRHFGVWTPSTLYITCARGQARTLKIAVVRLIARTGVEAAKADLLSDALIGELRKRPGLTVVTEGDVAAVLGLERQKALMGCNESSSCLTEIAGALGVDRIVHGSVGRVGASLLVNLSSLDAKTARPVTSVSERLKGASEEAFLDALPRVASQLLSEPSGTTFEAPSPGK
jgi:hypothetical protein